MKSMKLASLGSLLIVSALGALPAHAATYTITTPSGGDCWLLPGSWSGTTCVVSDMTLASDDALGILSGALRVEGTLVNDGGTLVVQDQLHVASGAVVDNRGEMSNLGTVDGGGGLLNSGTLDSSGSMGSVSLHNTGTVTAGGAISATVLDNTATGSISVIGILHTAGDAHNEGVISGNSLIAGGYFWNGGTMLIDAVEVAGTFENHGSIIASDQVLRLFSDGEFTNYGSLLIGPDSSVDTSQVPDGSFRNFGEMTARGYFIGHMINSGHLHVDGGTMDGVLVNTGTLDNDGTVESSLHNEASGIVTNDGLIHTVQGGSENDGTLINNGVLAMGLLGWFQSSDPPGRLVNRGLVDSLFSVSGGIVINECSGTFVDAFIWNATLFNECGCPLGTVTRLNTETFVTLELQVSEGALSWCEVPGAEYDVLTGDISALHGNGGDFSAATIACLTDSQSSNTLSETASPAPGEGMWFLVRAQNGSAGDLGTWNTGFEQDDRDLEIEVSGMECP